MIADFVPDWAREDRTGIAEAVLAESKSPEQLANIGRVASEQGQRMFFTRLGLEKFRALPPEVARLLDYDAVSRTATLGGVADCFSTGEVCIVAAGTSDMAVVGEAGRTLAFHGVAASIHADVGVAGLWRLMERIEDIRAHRIVIAVAGMEGALFSVIAGLVPSPVICVPTSVGYGVAAGGKGALSSALASCAPGLVAVNIDNGFGAACAALKIVARR